MRPAFRAVTIGLLAMLTTACTSGSVWTSPDSAPIRYHNLIVFGVTNSPKVRRAYEDNFVARLRESGVRVQPGHELVSDANLAQAANVTEALSKTSADAIIVTHLIADAHERQPAVSRLDSVPKHYHDLASYLSQVYEDVCGPDYYADFQALRLETNLYDAKRARLVWSSRSRQLDPNSEQTTISQVIGEVTARMISDGYLPPQALGATREVAQ